MPDLKYHRHMINHLFRTVYAFALKSPHNVTQNSKGEWELKDYVQLLLLLLVVVILVIGFIDLYKLQVVLVTVLVHSTKYSPQYPVRLICQVAAMVDGFSFLSSP